jgi:hypothetical protein
MLVIGSSSSSSLYTHVSLRERSHHHTHVALREHYLAQALRESTSTFPAGALPSTSTDSWLCGSVISADPAGTLRTTTEDATGVLQAHSN